MAKAQKKWLSLGAAKEAIAEAPVQESLADRIAALNADCDRHIDELVAAKKASKDGATLPIGVLRALVTKGDTCVCRVVERLLSEKN